MVGLLELCCYDYELCSTLSRYRKSPKFMNTYARHCIVVFFKSYDLFVKDVCYADPEIDK